MTAPAKPNPVAFNPVTMTARQLFDVAETMRTLIDGFDRGVPHENLAYHIDMARDQWNRIWDR